MKAVIPVAGMGTRMLPATKAIPKEMLPMIDVPIIERVVEEVMEAGIDHIIFITNASKGCIQQHFTGCDAIITSIFQSPRHKGLGGAILEAEPLIDGEDFVIALPDVLVDGSPLNQLVMYNDNVIATTEVSDEEVHLYGIVESEPRTELCIDIIEKPNAKDVTSRDAVIGRYKFTSTIFECLRALDVNSDQELELTQAISLLIETDRECVSVLKTQDRVYDCGSKLGYVKAFIDHAINHPFIGAKVRDHIDNIK